MSVGPALGGFLASWSFPSLFIVDGVTSLIAGGILVAARFPEHPNKPAEGASRPGPFLGAIRDVRLTYFLLVGILPVALVFFQHLSTMPVFLVHDLGLSEAAYGILFSVNTLLIVLLEVSVNTATGNWPHHRTLFLGAALCGIGFGALGVAWDFWSVTVTVVIWTFGEMLFFPGMAAYVSDLAPSERRGEYMGLTQLTMSLGFMLGPWGGTALLEHLGGRVVWGVVFVLGLVSAVFLSRLPEREAEKS
jgi:MFS family permease